MSDTHPIFTAYTAGWAWEGSERKHFFGTGVNCDYTGEVPEGLGYKVLRPVRKLK